MGNAMYHWDIRVALIPRTPTPHSENPKWWTESEKITFEMGVDLQIFEVTDFNFEGKFWI